MKCLYCQTESKGKFCSKVCKAKASAKFQEAINQNCPSIVGKDLSLDEKQMQINFLSKGA